MAQRYEIEAWVKPSAWDDQDQAHAVIDEIMDTGSSDEEIWEAIARRADGATVESLANEYRGAQQRTEQALRHIRGTIKYEYHLDSSHGRKVELAQRAGISRVTLDAWLAHTAAEDDEE